MPWSSRKKLRVSPGEERKREIEHIGGLLEKKQRELESLDNSIASKTGELESLSDKLEENKSALQTLENEIARRKAELEITPPTEEELSKTWKEKLKIYDEIDKSLAITEEDTLKTKK